MTTSNPASLTVRAMFGTLGERPEAGAPRMARHAARLDSRLQPGQIALITGPSGSGKSSLARALLDRCPSAVASDSARVDPASPLVDALTGPLARRLAILSSVGLADARIFTRRAGVLSVGERARFEIALAINHAGHAAHASARSQSAHPTTIILDEFASTLDRPTALRVAHLLRRSVDRSTFPLRVVCITAHDDLTPALRPDVSMHVGSIAPRAASTRPDHADSTNPIGRIEPGTIADLAALASHHYRAGSPAVLAGPRSILRCIDPATSELMGVLALAMPTLNAPWRDAIWPARYRTRDKRADAARLHRELRCIARVIVSPRHRGLGVASLLVRHYLAHPLTPATEALAAMGRASPFFRAAGMRAYHLPPTPRDARLLDALSFLDMTPASLAALDTPRAHLPRSHPLLWLELRRWAGSSRATRAIAGQPRSVLRRAAGALLARPVVYAHVSAHASTHTQPEPPHARLAPLAA